jgi:hypothetical protein
VNKPVLIREYECRQTKVAAEFQAGAAEMVSEGYFPTAQTYVPGAYSGTDFLLALLTCLIGVGFFRLLYMLIVQPPGVLVVTYELRSMA